MPASNGELLLVRGSPGVGKTTAVRLLRKMLPHGATIEVDVLRAMLHGVDWRDPREHTLTLDEAAAWAARILQSGRGPVVLVDTLARSRLTGFASNLPMPYRIASLYARPDVLRARIAARPDGEFKDLDACLVINAEIERFRYPRERLIDTSDLKPAEVADQLLAWLTEVAP